MSKTATAGDEVQDTNSNRAEELNTIEEKITEGFWLTDPFWQDLLTFERKGEGLLVSTPGVGSKDTFINPDDFKYLAVCDGCGEIHIWKRETKYVRMARWQDCPHHEYIHEDCWSIHDTGACTMKLVIDAKEE